MTLFLPTGGSGTLPRARVLTLCCAHQRHPALVLASLARSDVGTPTCTRAGILTQPRTLGCRRRLYRRADRAAHDPQRPAEQPGAGVAGERARLDALAAHRACTPTHPAGSATPNPSLAQSVPVPVQVVGNHLVFRKSLTSFVDHSSVLTQDSTNITVSAATATAAERNACWWAGWQTGLAARGAAAGWPPEPRWIPRASWNPAAWRAESPLPSHPLHHPSPPPLRCCSSTSAAHASTLPVGPQSCPPPCSQAPTRRPPPRWCTRSTRCCCRPVWRRCPSRLRPRHRPSTSLRARPRQGRAAWGVSTQLKNSTVTVCLCVCSGGWGMGAGSTAADLPTASNPAPALHCSPHHPTPFPPPPRSGLLQLLGQHRGRSDGPRLVDDDDHGGLRHLGLVGLAFAAVFCGDGGQN